MAAMSLAEIISDMVTKANVLEETELSIREAVLDVLPDANDLKFMEGRFEVDACCCYESHWFYYPIVENEEADEIYLSLNSGGGFSPITVLAEIR